MRMHVGALAEIADAAVLALHPGEPAAVLSAHGMPDPMPLRVPGMATGANAQAAFLAEHARGPWPDGAERLAALEEAERAYLLAAGWRVARAPDRWIAEDDSVWPIESALRVQRDRDAGR
jgi:hypothetical protein